MAAAPGSCGRWWRHTAPWRDKGSVCSSPCPLGSSCSSWLKPLCISSVATFLCHKSQRHLCRSRRCPIPISVLVFIHNAIYWGVLCFHVSSWYRGLFSFFSWHSLERQGRACRNLFMRATLMERLLAPFNSYHPYCCAGSKATPPVTEPDWHPVPHGPRQGVCGSLAPAAGLASRVGGSPSHWLAEVHLLLSEFKWMNQETREIHLHCFFPGFLSIEVSYLHLYFYYIGVYSTLWPLDQFSWVLWFFSSLKSTSFSSPLIDLTFFNCGYLW